MKIVMKKISDLKPADYNPRSLTTKQFEDLRKSFQNLGTLEPAVVNQFAGRENVIVSGHQRIRVASSLGMKEYPCVEVVFPLEKEKEANVRMNKNTGAWDLDILANEFDVEELKDWGFMPFELGIDKAVDYEKEWTEMPEFQQEDLTSFRRIIVHFESDRDVKAFAQLMGQSITDKTKSIWHPEQKSREIKDKRYADES